MNYHRTVTVNGVPLRLAISEGKVWARLSDLCEALELPRCSVDRHLSKVALDHKKTDGFKFVDEFAVKHVCISRVKASSSRVFLKWLNSGGMRLPQAGKSTLPSQETGTVPTGHKTLDSAYCESLIAVLIQHSSKNEIKRFVQLVECEVAGILVRRPCKELNDARHELYSRFYLQGGEK
ncbi:hypothetical protein U8080_007007 [Pseudomonas aeruginosa]|nr:hypothetical protein [Pseudomonas aeruginosa]